MDMRPEGSSLKPAGANSYRIIELKEGDQLARRRRVV